MQAHEFIKVYNEGRNGANFFYKHNLVKYFRYSDGVQECAKTGCYWLLDIAATELPKKMRQTETQFLTLEIKVSSKKAQLSAVRDGDVLPVWWRKIDHTDLPEGEWKFLISDEEDTFAMILPSEY